MASSRANHSGRLVSHMLGAGIRESVAVVSLDVPKGKVNLSKKWFRASHPATELGVHCSSQYFWIDIQYIYIICIYIYKIILYYILFYYIILYYIILYYILLYNILYKYIYIHIHINKKSNTHSKTSGTTTLKSIPSTRSIYCGAQTPSVPS
jgi:hypothetical protein